MRYLNPVSYTHLLMDQYLLIIVAFAVAFIAALVIGKILIPVLKKLHFGQQILTEEGPSWHASKQGTPTMGGFIFIIAVLIAYFATAFSYYTQGNTISSAIPLPTGTLTGLVVALLFGFMGFIDDFVKVAKKRNLGLTVVQKILIQIFISAAYLVFLGKMCIRDREHNVQNRLAGVIMNVKTGEVLAMSSKPDYDPNSPFTITDEMTLELLKQYGEGTEEYYTKYNLSLIHI